MNTRTIFGKQFNLWDAPWFLHCWEEYPMLERAKSLSCSIWANIKLVKNFLPWNNAEVTGAYDSLKLNYWLIGCYFIKYELITKSSIKHPIFKKVLQIYSPARQWHIDYVRKCRIDWKKLIISASADGGPRYRVCAR